MTCPDDGETKVPVTIYVDEIKVIRPKEHNIDIVLDDKMSLRMKYPSLNQFIESNFSLDKEDDTSFDIVASCMDMVFSEDEAWEAKDSTKEELISFLEQLNSTQFREIETFFDTMPKLSHEIEVENPDTKVKSTVKLEGLANFFA